MRGAVGRRGASRRPALRGRPGRSTEAERPVDCVQHRKNLQRDDRIALSIVDPANPYRYLEIRGRVVRIDPDPDKAFIDSMAKKYLGQDKYPWHQPGDERVVMVVAAEHTTQMGA